MDEMGGDAGGEGGVNVLASANCPSACPIARRALLLNHGEMRAGLAFLLMSMGQWKARALPQKSRAANNSMSLIFRISMWGSRQA